MELHRISIPLAALVALSGCSGGSSGGSSSSSVEADETSNDGTTALVVDASDYEAYRYLNLETGELLDLSAAEAGTSTEWHLGFRRNSVIVNGGASGPGQVGAALVAAQDDFYLASGEPDSNVFLNATPDSELEHLLASYDAAGLTFTQDEIVAAVMGSGDMTGTLMDLGWYNYDMATHSISVNDSNAWILRSAEGNSFATLQATALTYDRTTGLAVTFSLNVEAAGTQGFVTPATFAASLPAEGGQQCFDFDTNAVVDCASDSWDLQLEVAGRDWNVWLNSGASGTGQAGAFGILDAASLGDYAGSAAIPEQHYVTDSPAGLFLESDWYAYNLSGGHKLWPNYRVYLIDTDISDDTAARYQLQITNYYSEAGTSGHPNLRFISADTAE